MIEEYVSSSSFIFLFTLFVSISELLDDPRAAKRKWAEMCKVNDVVSDRVPAPTKPRFCIAAIAIQSRCRFDAMRLHSFCCALRVPQATTWAENRAVVRSRDAPPTVGVSANSRRGRWPSPTYSDQTPTKLIQTNKRNLAIFIFHFQYVSFLEFKRVNRFYR